MFKISNYGSQSWAIKSSFFINGSASNWTPVTNSETQESVFLVVLRCRYVQLNFTQFFCTNYVVREWNRLPILVKQCSTIKSFQNKQGFWKRLYMTRRSCWLFVKMLLNCLLLIVFAELLVNQLSSMSFLFSLKPFVCVQTFYLTMKTLFMFPLLKALTHINTSIRSPLTLRLSKECELRGFNLSLSVKFLIPWIILVILLCIVSSLSIFIIY